jgi:deoxyribodipyrimidine photolyase-related protein
MSNRTLSSTCRNLVLVLGDQLNTDSAAFDHFDVDRDVVWMAEVAEEATHVWTHKARIVLFLASMRHFRDTLKARKIKLHYRQLDELENGGSLVAELRTAVKQFRPERLIVVQPGEWRVHQELLQAAKKMKIHLELRPDRHFLSTPEEFAEHAAGRKQLRLEYFYRELRRKHDVLMNGKEPVGGTWNFDSENRGAFGRKGPGTIPATQTFSPDETTAAVINLVNRNFPKHPGKLDQFDWPVNRDQAQQALDDFITHRLPRFGQFQDAMWTNEPYLYHSRLAAALNLKLLDPREVIQAAVAAYHAGHAALNSVEGFVRQILGWREYVRGIYWLYMPEYLSRNELGATAPLPDFYWTGATEMNCLRQAIGQTLDYGYAHHIQRLMVTGLFSLLLGVDPKLVHQWYLAVYVDAIEWVELPNSLGMSQFADGGVMASKPYVASGKYIQRMSNYCGDCRFDPATAVGHNACPFTTLYWDFLVRHKEQLGVNHRMSMQLRNLDRKQPAELTAIQQQADSLRASLR